MQRKREVHVQGQQVGQKSCNRRRTDLPNVVTRVLHNILLSIVGTLAAAEQRAAGVMAEDEPKAGFAAPGGAGLGHEAKASIHIT